MTETSIFLARVIGLVAIISAASILVAYKKSITFEEEAVKNPLFIHVSGFVFLILGALIVVSHPIWVFDWRIVITLLGWILLLKGIGRMLFPEAVGRMIKKKKTNRWFILGEVAVIFIGIYLLYYGFIVY